MFKKFFIVNLFICLLSSIAFSEVVNEVEISGNKRLSNESILVFGEIKLSQDYTTNDLNNILKNLYETNFFKDINISLNNGLMTLKILENPIIEDLQITGVKNSKFEEYLLDKLNLKSRNSFVKSALTKDKNLLTNILKQSGYYFSEVKTSITIDKKKNSVRLVFDINLGKKAKINQIIFIGDKKIKDKKLKNIIASEEAKFWKFISKNVFLDQSKIQLDIRLLENYYKNKGYYNITITNSFAELKDDSSFKLIYNINAGQKFIFNDLELLLPIDYDPSKFIKIKDLLAKLKNEFYSLNKLNSILNEVDKIAISKQYDFVNAVLKEEIIENKINIKVVLEDSEKFYVEKINIYGNQYTLEETIRNNLIVDEGDPFNKILFNKSINNIKSKNYFKTVESKVSPGSSNNFKILSISVEEKPTGEISLGAGIGTAGATIGGGIRENNFLGKGIALDTNLSIESNKMKGSFTYTRPNFNYTENTLFTSLSSTSTDNLKNFGYKTNELAFSIGTSFEQYENLSFSPSISSKYENLETNSTATAIRKSQDGDYTDLYFNYSLDYDLRDQQYQASDGYQSVFYQEVPLNSKNGEIINSYQFTKYQSLFSDMVGKLSFYGKAANSLTNKDVRISKRLYIPASKLRGFEYGRLGPIDENAGYLGGNYISALNLSTTLPQILPAFQNIDFSYFIDIGNVWGVDYDSTLDKTSTIRSSTGIAVNFLSPMGPLNFSFAQPITKKSSDKTESFRFDLGTTF